MSACRYPGCRASAEDARPTCRDHWRIVPGPLRRRVVDAAAAFYADPFDQAARDAFNGAIRLAGDSLAEDRQPSTDNRQQ